MQFEVMKKPEEEKSDMLTSKLRMYDKDGFSLRGCCVVWDSDKKINILLIKNKKGNWCLPGGGIENFDISFLDGALRELKEEAGILGKVINYVGNFKDEIGKNKHSTFVWSVKPLKVFEDYKENYREREWFTYEDAYTNLSTKPIHQNILINAKKNIITPAVKEEYSTDLKHEYDIWKNTNIVWGKT
tara:strand:- start:227 stop:787 length:561 start_codon:yes stop_codon:yes gene_type:complete